MFLHRNVIVGAMLAGCLVSSALAYDFGRRATPDEVKLWDIDVRPDGKGLPEGSGTVAHGKSVYEENCAACHGANGQDGIKDRLVGGQGNSCVGQADQDRRQLLALCDDPVRIRRAMPYQAPGSLSVDDTYAVAAYTLNLNGILPADGKLDKETLPKIKMPNRDGLIPEPEFRKITNSK
jgi:S-disulfanyl-L-cysteine oxidoreductase SoxD